MSNVEYNAEARKNIAYKFMCEHCGKENTRKHVIAVSSGNQLSADTAEMVAAEYLETKMANFIENCNNGNFPFEGECSYCHKHQSWESKNSRKYPVVGFIVGLILGFFIMWLFILPNKPELWYLPLLIGASIGFLIGFKWHLEIKIQTKKVKNKELPTYTIL